MQAVRPADEFDDHTVFDAGVQGPGNHADDLTAEAVDVLQKIVLGGTLQDANAKAVDDLLDSL